MEGWNIHPSVLNSITTLLQRINSGELKRHVLFIEGANRANNVYNRQNVQLLVDFLNGDSGRVTDLTRECCSLAQPSDGGIEVLRDFFKYQYDSNRSPNGWLCLWYISGIIGTSYGVSNKQDGY
jgi:hypothetical protein